MGNYLSEQQLWIESDELDYYSTEHERNLGTVDIFTSNRRLPMSYIMRLEQPLEEEASELVDLYQKVQAHRTTDMIRMYDCRKVVRCGCGSLPQPRRLQSYWEYYNFYLTDLIGRRIARSVFFNEAELWYLVKVCCEGYLSLKEKGILMQMGTDQLTVTPQGKLKLFWAHISPKNAHLGYYRRLLFGQATTGRCSPQELECFRNRQRSARLDLEKCNVYTFGMTLLYCMTLIDAAHFYTKADSIDFGQLNRTIAAYKQKQVYSSLLWQLLDQCLQVQPNHRPTFGQIRQRYGSRFQEDFSMSIISSQMEKQEPERSLMGSVGNQTRISLKKQESRTSGNKTKSQFSSVIS